MKKYLLIIFALFSCLLLFAFCFFFYIFIPIQPQTAEIAVAEGKTLRQIAEQLEKDGVIRDANAFIAYAALTGGSEKVQAGEYRLAGALSIHRVLDTLVKGEVILHKVQIIEGWTIRQIADYLRMLDFIDDPTFAGEFLELAKEHEGYLLPDTYHFSRQAGPRKYVETFLKAFNDFYPEAKPEIVTLASIIEKETGLEEERPLIASVFYNRLNKRMGLASDPTVIYGLKNFDGNLRKEDLSNPHPYNTYVHAGLPPGPICNPGRASILAALNPAQTDYLYFVSKNDGSHHFSSTLAEHNQAVRKYQQAQQ
ncbi:MAG: endolytic transglycosylase MltG [Deltaproteobacteria bacterium]|nr:endolytic transglycosylase MltG [Deltaproteobacteria bacterium]MBI4224687.1 endolytic transglycosylase MltG [Deltaproteobacteria bacterium]